MELHVLDFEYCNDTKSLDLYLTHEQCIGYVLLNVNFEYNSNQLTDYSVKDSFFKAIHKDILPVFLASYIFEDLSYQVSKTQNAEISNISDIVNALSAIKIINCNIGAVKLSD